MTVEIIIQSPAEGENWYAPTKWKLETKLIEDVILWIDPHEWNGVSGHNVYFLKGTASYWYFTTSRMKFHH